MKTNESMKIRITLGAICLFALVVIFAGCSEDFLFNSSFFSYEPAVDLDRNFEWYQTQMDSGPASGNNCGPAAVSMAVEFIQARSVKVEEVRNLSYGNGGWWYMSDVKNALSHFNIGYKPLPLKCKEQLFHSLSQGHIVIVCLNMSLVTKENNNSESKHDRFYDRVTGHFIIIKGYSADQQWFIAYDSNNFRSDYYPDRTPKGQDRLYSIEEVMNSMYNWNPSFLEL